MRKSSRAARLANTTRRSEASSGSRAEMTMTGSGRLSTRAAKARESGSAAALSRESSDMAGAYRFVAAQQTRACHRLSGPRARQL